MTKTLTTLTKSEVLTRLRDAIREAGSQKAFAEKCGVSTSYMSDIANGARMPTDRVLRHLRIKRMLVFVHEDYGLGE
jgi:transcriptional regulator with XRE-family HTH domain